MEVDNPPQKIMEKVSHEWVVHNYSTWSRMQSGMSFQSDDVVHVGNLQLKIIIYPGGKSEAAQQDGMMSICIRNESQHEAEVVFSFGIAHQYGFPYLELQRSLFHDRGLFRRVMILPPGEEVGIMHFKRLADIERRRHSYIKRDSIKLKTLIGVFVNHQPHYRQPSDRFIFFQVQDKRYYAEESMIRSRCPAFCSNGTEFPYFVLENIDPDTFDAVLWFIYHKKLNIHDKKDICTCDVSDPNSLGVGMVRAARRYRLDLLKETCESIIFYGSLDIHDIIFPISRGLRRAWRILRGQWAHKSSLELLLIKK